METKIPIADRITYEAWGTEANPHSPLWGIEILKKKGEGMSGLIIKPEELSKLKNLERNSTLETLATRWATESVNQPLDGKKWASYATSGSETNGKEFLQLLALTKELHKYHPNDTAGIYFIDTASHSMRPQFETEIMMYAATTGLSAEEIREAYFSLFKVDLKYIDNFANRISTSEEQRQRINLKWAERAIQLDVPADAILLPEKEKYIEFCRKVGISEEITTAIEKAFEFIKSRDDIPKSLGSLRCAIFTEVSNLIIKKLGFQYPIIAVPFDEAAIKTGWGQLTMKEIRRFSAETFIDRVAYYNVLEPETGIETPLYNTDEENEKKRKADRNQETKNSIQSSLSNSRYDHLTYEAIMKHGHFSGMGYYHFLLTNSIGSMAFVLDNYEAGGPHARIIRAAIEGRFQSKVIMVGYPRGWVRIASFVGDENSTYGASPPIELLASEIFKDPNGIGKITQYITLLNQGIGDNMTIALDTLAEGSQLYIIPDNRRFATSKINTPFLFETDFEKALEILNVLNEFTKTPNLQTYLQIAQLGLAEIDSEIEKLATLNKELAEITTCLEEKSQEFLDRYKVQITRYFTNRQIAISRALNLMGKSFLDDENGQRTLPVVIETPQEIQEHQTQKNAKQAQIISDWMYLKARKIVESSSNRQNINEKSPLYLTYQSVTKLIEIISTFQKAESAKKCANSLIKAWENNHSKLAEAINCLNSDQNTQDQAVNSFIAMFKELIAQGHTLDLHNILSDPATLLQILQSTTEFINTTKKKLIIEYGLVEEKGEIKKGELEKTLKLASEIRRTIDAFCSTNYESELADKISAIGQNCTISNLHELCLSFCMEKASEISSIVRGKTGDENKPRFANSRNALDYAERFAQTYQRIQNFKSTVRRIWTELNTNDNSLEEYLNAYRQHLEELDPLIAKRNETQSSIAKLKEEAEKIIMKTREKLAKTVIIIK